jgi:hypothetical protein
MTSQATDPAPRDPRMSRDADPARRGRDEGPPGARGPGLAIVRGFGRVLGAMPRPVAAGAALGWMVLIWWLSSGPIDFRPPLPAAGFVWNLAHAPVFGLLAALVAAAAAPRPLPADWPRPGRTACLVALLVAMSWAAADEYHQSRVDGRHGSLFDFATDVTGAAGALWLASYAGRRGAHERGMRGRIALAIGLCAALAGLTTIADRLGAS